MFNLLVSGTAGAWEGEHLDMDVQRFNSFSGKMKEQISADDPAALRQLEGYPALVMYEVGVIGPNAEIVRHGRLANIARFGKVISFEFEADPVCPYLPREKILFFERHLDMDEFEQGHTHWAIKDGNLPPALLKLAFKELPLRTPDIIAKQYLDAIDRRRGFAAQSLRDELMALAAGPETDEARRRAGLVQETGSSVPAVETVVALAPGVDTLPTGARVVVVIVALENYRKEATNQIESVEFARADAEAFKALVEDVFKDHRPEVALLIDDRATYASVRNEIARHAWSLGPDDLFVFYYAGHGFHDPTGNRLTVWDTAPINVEGTTLAIHDDLLARLRASPCQRVLAFIDACASKFKPVGRAVITPFDTAEFTELLRSSAFCATFLSCRPGEQSFPDRDLGHGIWTHYLLRALSGQAEGAVGPGRYVTNVSLQDYLRQGVPRHVANNPRIDGTQTPEAVVTATSTFAIRKVPEPVTVVLAAPPPLAPARPSQSSTYNGSSTQFFAERFRRAFPGVRGIRWFDKPVEVRTRLTRLLEAPLTFDAGNPVWWWRDGNLQIGRFQAQDDGTSLMDVAELNIRRIAAVSGRAYWQSFVYVETAATPPTGCTPAARSSVPQASPSGAIITKSTDWSTAPTRSAGRSMTMAQP
jgi:hypothetical protein